MTTYEEALDTILATACVLESESLPVADALGRCLAADLVAVHDSPRFDNSAVDGFAVRSADVAAAREASPVSLRVVGTVLAGDDATSMNVGEGETVRTMTGAMIAPGTDAMVMQEDVDVSTIERGEGSASFTEPAKKGQAVRQKGEEYSEGDLLVPRGTTCSPAVLALVASQGFDKVLVGRAPRVGVLTTGSELARPGAVLAPGQIYESNSTALAVAVRSLTGRSPVASSSADDVEAIAKAFEAMLNECDVVVTTGGASVGEKDLVREALLECGVQEKFWRIAMKPGKPVSFGVHPKGALVFALPGNPVSAQVTFALLVAPAIRKMMRASEPVPPYEQAVLGSCIKRVAGRKEFIRATTRYEGGRLFADPLPGQGSHMARGVAIADRLIVVEPDVDCLNAGTIVETLPWR